MKKYFIVYERLDWYAERESLLYEQLRYAGAIDQQGQLIESLVEVFYIGKNEALLIKPRKGIEPAIWAKRNCERAASFGLAPYAIEPAALQKRIDTWSDEIPFKGKKINIYA